MELEDKISCDGADYRVYLSMPFRLVYRDRKLIGKIPYDAKPVNIFRDFEGVPRIEFAGTYYDLRHLPPLFQP